VDVLKTSKDKHPSYSTVSNSRILQNEHFSEQSLEKGENNLIAADLPVHGDHASPEELHPETLT